MYVPRVDLGVTPIDFVTFKGLTESHEHNVIQNKLKSPKDRFNNTVKQNHALPINVVRNHNLHWYIV